MMSIMALYPDANFELSWLMPNVLVCLKCGALVPALQEARDLHVRHHAAPPHTPVYGSTHLAVDAAEGLLRPRPRDLGDVIRDDPGLRDNVG